jgi:NAD+ diphosphatase
MHISETHPSKILKFCPVCGSNKFHFDGEKAFNCSDCNFRYYINEAASTAGIIVNPKGEIILTKRKFEPRSGYFDLPGGFVDLGERAEDCMIREINEELGLKVDKITFLASFPNEYLFRGISYYTCDLAFVCEVSDFTNLKPADDVAEAVFVSPKQINFDTISFPSIVSILKKYIETLP